jgi:peptidoglycan/xylan/chitin deacetylase (PgdA/CDA1 family)
MARPGSRKGRALLTRLAGAIGRPLAFLVQPLMRMSARRVGLALVYHRVGDPPGDPDRELVPARGTAQFESELRHLKRCYRVVPAARLLEAAAGRRRGQRFPVAITFDDDLSSHADIAMPILERQGLPATFFVGGTSLNGPVTFWWQSLQAAFDAGKGAEAAATVAQATNDSTAGERPDIHELARRIERMDRDRRAEVSAGLQDMTGAAPNGLSAEQLRGLASRGFEIGFHTRRHDRLPLLADDDLRAAMVDGRDDVAAACGQPVALISYPHGAGDERVAQAARDAGYTQGFVVAPEPAGPATNPFLIGRVGPTIRSPGRGALQIALSLMALWRA